MRTVLITLLLPIIFIGHSQNIGFGLGGNLGSLTFKSEEVNAQRIKGLPGANFQFSVSQNMTKRKAGFSKFRKELNQLFLSAGYKSIRLEDVQSTVISNWTMHFLASQLGFRSHFPGAKKTNLFYTIGGTYDYLAGGTQINGFNRFEIQEIINNHNYGVFGEVGLNYLISDESYCTIGVGYLRGLANLEKDANQTARLHGIQVTVAIHFTK